MWPSCRNRNASRMCARARALRRMEDSARQGRHAHRDEIAGRPVMTPIPAVVPPLPRERTWKRNVAPAAALDWLSAGWRDFTIHPGASISYGLLVFLVSVVTVVGGLFAAFAFAISAFSIPMLLTERTDALTAMGTSMALVWNNLPVMLTWAAIMLALIFVGIVTGLLGMIVVFPVLGHGSWHA